MRKIFSALLIIICLNISGVCLYRAYQYWDKYQRANKTYDKMKQEFTEEEGKKASSGKWLKINWKKLKKQNPDIVGWIYMSSGADYPIVQGKTNNDYLHTDPYGDYSINGSIMLNCYNNKDFQDKHTVLYGHNMKNGSMFGSNKKYKDTKYAKKHKYFYVFTPEGRYVYKIYQIHTVYDATRIYTVDFDGDKEFKEWLNTNEKNADGKIGEQAKPEDSVMTLSTCMSKGDMRFVIQGYLKQFETYDHKTTKNRDDLKKRFNEIREEEEEKKEEIKEEE